MEHAVTDLSLYVYTSIRKYTSHGLHTIHSSSVIRASDYMQQTKLKEHVVHPSVLKLCIVQQIKLCTHICASLGQNVHMYAFTDFSVPCNIYVYLCHSMCLQRMEFSKFSALLPLASPLQGAKVDKIHPLAIIYK